MRVDRIKRQPASYSWAIGILSRWWRAGVLSGLGFCLVCARTVAADAVVIGVRSTLASPTATASLGRIYTILTIQQISAWEKVVHPVEVNELLELLRQSLTAQGFQAAKSRQPPEIVLTVEYGRDWLDNPYLSGTGNSSTVSGITSAMAANGAEQSLEKVPNQTIAGAPVQLMNHLGTGVEARAQKAGYEKLYLRITAWRYPPDSKTRAIRLWSTTMTVDDPASDLNVLATGMLAAGAPYFGRAIAEPELEVSQPVPNGRVKLGEPRVIDAPASKSEVRPPLKVSVSVGSEEQIKPFHLLPGAALATLREFARQADTEIVYSSAQISGIKTPAVSGNLSPRAALGRLLDGTGLVAIPDEQSGAFVIRPSPNH